MSKKKYKVTISMVMPPQDYYIYASSHDDLHNQVNELALDEGTDRCKVDKIIELPISMMDGELG